VTDARRPPRLLHKTLAVTFASVAILLLIVFVVVTLNVRDQVRESVRLNLEPSQRMFAALEARRQRELHTQAATLAENPMLKAALDTYQAESRAGNRDVVPQLRATINDQLGKLVAPLDADAVVLVDTRGHVIASAGRMADRWPPDKPAAFGAATSAESFDGTVHAGNDVFRVISIPLVVADAKIGTLYPATLLDNHYAEELARIAGTPVAIVSDGITVGTTLAPETAREFERKVGTTQLAEDTVELGGESYGFRRIVRAGDTSFYALSSVDQMSRAMMSAATWYLAFLAAGAFALALAASVWLARTVSEPIGQLSNSLAAIAASRNVTSRLRPDGSSRELDELTETFNALMASVATAEEQTQSAYTGAIQALATALDARDPYTAGHSERVSVLSVAIGRTLGLPVEALEVLRLGGLLHDIGKIGVPDEVLRKPGALTAAEFDKIKQHTVLGARILRPVPFLAAHIPIVELHHERPDGRGYPHGLRGEEIPRPAAIVHVADAYDAITSARAYRAARSPADAMQELWKHAGTEFQADIVSALATAVPGVRFEDDPAERLRA
jgi:putative nucleotidyltransferase with HDIG domain